MNVYASGGDYESDHGAGTERMTDNIAKREEARQVWRLNKKEGVPVLEALETANISKDTYYDYKQEYESDWEEQLLTVREIDERLEKLSDELSDLHELADKVEERIEGVDEIGQKIERVEEAREDMWSVEDKFWKLSERLDLVEQEVGYSFDPEEDGPPVTVEEVDGKVHDQKHRIDDVVERVEELERRMGNLESAHDSDMKSVWEDVHRAANQGLFASDSALHHNL